MKATTILGTCLLGALLGLSSGCSSDDASSVSMEAPEAPPFPEAPTPVIEESDIYRQSGNYLYIQNNQTGLNILDTSMPDRPYLVGRAPMTNGLSGELYIREQTAIILLESASSSCRNPENMEPGAWQTVAEVVLVDTRSKASPMVTARYCLPGSLVDSRVVGDMLYLVTTKPSCGSRIMSLDISTPSRARVVDQMDFPHASEEILVTSEAIFVAGLEQGTDSLTRLQYISINTSGILQLRGSFLAEGLVPGRFHMDATSDQFRVVTFEPHYQRSRLTILDISDPDQIQLMGFLRDIGHGEQLYATRFDGDRAYVVTYRQTDPLWIISLEDPYQPRLIGELHVPGWSDFIFPRGDKLLTVGRGDRGSYLGLSLFDVSDPARPVALSQISLGDPDTTSEANVDHRAVTIVEMPGALPLVVVPHTRVRYSSGCEVSDQLDLVEVAGDRLQIRGLVVQQGTIRRTFPISEYLYSISDYEVLAVDITNRDHPAVRSTVTLGNQLSSDGYHNEYCQYMEGYNNNQQPWRDGFYHESPHFLCSLGEGRVGFPPTMVLIGIFWLLFRLRRRQDP